MKGRCEIDPFKPAVNVCRSCYGEFCDDCLVYAKRHRDPLCRDCTLVAAGIRPGARIRLRGEKRTAKQRRHDLIKREALAPQSSLLAPLPEPDTAPEGTNERPHTPTRDGDTAPTTALNPSPPDEGLPAAAHAATSTRRMSAVEQLQAIRERDQGPWENHPNQPAAGKRKTDATTRRTEKATDPP